uniref:NADH-ubiquinone oxidoreductase chain 4L n=1 Tax=Arytainilla spartiophila TaxID=178948 RepID=A0A344A262_ARYSP|nr:NADH dehydrogenase subunit 4L [Arytainilla spartiophila]AWU48853.1 NADH dehydrogenase subunit 4L [Arytainilla spartiophila]
MCVFVGSIFMFYISLMSYFFKKNHLLTMLVLLEFMSISILLMLLNFFSNFCYDSSILIYFIIIFVCEAVMGLVLLTLFVRCHGSDYFQSSSIFLC